MITKLFTVLITVFLLACIGNDKKQSFISSEVKNIQAKPQILICSDNKSKTFVDFINREKIQFVQFVNDGQFIDSKVPFTFSEDLLLKELQRAYPDPKSSGIAYIDIEYPYTDYLLKENITSSNYKKSVKLFLDVLSFVKKERPNVKWGYYGIPFTTYWGRDKKFYDQYKKVDEIIKKSDILFPSIYIFYNNVSFNLENKGYLKENTEEMLRIASLYNKKVYPFVMSRYHPSNKSIGNEQIDNSDYKTYISTIAKAEYKNKHIDGLVLWNADGYAYRVNEPVLKKELEKNKIGNFDAFYDQYIIGLLSLMKKEVE
ncbi:hypothetical protein A0O34_13990 [Chryseobacterium glaciei]|uniref:Hyaluronidase n=1 Tax=Chryseobacterium glaciei TaxID=1685010 RepID=A0A172XXK0_9FLAO|nr:hypothetical protein [Chryseobacterium glaciei]ANF51545.1 hypothetical protein A0O34_13990 [Chryseobacterium glaciei]